VSLRDRLARRSLRGEPSSWPAWPSPIGRIVSGRMHRWIAGWALDRARKATIARPEGERHVLVAVCDHFEPLHGRVPYETGLTRVRAWRERYPALASRFRDSSGRGPRHTFFFPGEEYHPDFLEPLAELVEAGLGEIEVHLHHDGDTRSSLKAKLEQTLSALAVHGVVPSTVPRGAPDGNAWPSRKAPDVSASSRNARDVGAGLPPVARPAWAFIHGNWALANGRPDGRWCGVDDELALLHELGCYADFTFPSAPDPCQPSIVNRIYYPRDDAQRRAYDFMDRGRAGAPASRARARVLLVQGPLAIARREPHRGLGLRLETGALDAGDPPTAARLGTWVDQFVHVDGRPEWTFVKLHTHGAPEANARMLLGAPMAGLHEALAALASRDPWRVHYVTAREMYNVARAAMDGMRGSPAAYFDYEVPAAPRARREPT
jgi:hypothetical protein